MSAISRIYAREVLDSRGKPTVEAEVWLASGACGRAIAPSGASTGAAEACELRDGDPARYDGQGVRKAVSHVNGEISAAICGILASDQQVLDAKLIALDGTPNKSRLGANAILAVSLAAAHAAAAEQKQPLYRWFAELTAQITGAADRLRMPLPMTNMISGGKHAGGQLDFQDVLIVPHGAADYPTGLEWIVRVYRRLGKLLSEAGFEGVLVGDEGGFGPRLPSNRAALEFVVRAIEKAGLVPGEQVSLALDVAASHFRQPDGYRLAAENRVLTAEELIDRFDGWLRDFPIRSIEDPLAEDDWDGWRQITARLGDRVKLVGDDLFATNREILAKGVSQGVANAVLIKFNQVGTVTESLQTMHLAAQHGYLRVVSARSGETEDDTLADFAVGSHGEMIKIGSIARSERLAKYNRLLRIAEELS